MYSPIFPNSIMSIFPSLTPDKYTRPVGSLAGASIKLMNFTNYDVKVLVGADQVDLIPAYQYLIMPNEPDLFLTIVTPESTNYIYPQSYIAAKTFDDVLAYEIGSLIHFMSVSPGDTVNVSGSMTISNTPNVFVNGGSLSVNISGSPTFQLAAGTSVNIGNTPSVSLVGSPSVNIGNTPTVNVGGTVSVQLTASGNSVNIANTPAVSISGTPSMNVANTSIPVTNYAGGTLNIAGQVNIGNTPAVTVNGTVNTNITSGSVNATIQNASLNSNVTNALLQTGSLAKSTTHTLTISNLANGASTGLTGVTLPESMYDSILFFVTCNDDGIHNIYAKYTPVYGGYGRAGYYDKDTFNNGSGYTLKQGIDSPDMSYNTYFQTLPIPLQPNGNPDFASTVWMNFINNSGSTIVSDTITIIAYGHYASQLVTNQSYQPVPISSNYYGTGADGALHVTSGNTALQNTANQPAIFNYSSITVDSGTSITFANQAKYAILYCTGDVTINGTLYNPNGVTNIGSPANPLSINGKTVPNAGSGGNGGSASGYNGTSAGGSGGAGNCYASGAGGGGGAGQYGGAGASGGTGYGNAAGGTGYSYNGHAAGNGTGDATQNSATLCIVAGGTITINGTIYGSGVAGGNGGAGWYGAVDTVPNYYSMGGGGGSCGSNHGGNGSVVANSTSNSYGGGGAGGSGGAAVFLFSGGATYVNGTINVNAGGGGSGGGGVGGNAVAGNAGTAGTSGSVTIWQLGGSGGGL